MRQAARRTASDRGPFPFFSTCPECGQQQLQLAHTRRALLRLLASDNVIDAYCLACDVVWTVGAQDRNSVATAIAAGEPSATPAPRGNHPPRRPL